MSVRLRSQRAAFTTNAATVRRWAMIFMTAGVAGRSLIQNALLNTSSVSMEELAAAMSADSTVTILVTAALICQIVETCAVPLFSFLLVEGFRKTSGFEKYLIRVCALALVSEIPYNFAMAGKLLDLGSRNPVFGLVICLVMLYLYRRFAGKGLKNLAMKALITVAAFLWCRMLRIDHGIFFVILVGVLWLVRDKDNMRAIYGFSGALICTMFTPYYIASCMSFLFLHLYVDEPVETNRKFNYAFYPVLLLVCGGAALFLA